MALLAGGACLAADMPALATNTAMALALKRATPAYPMAAKQLHVMGSQEVEVTVSKTGEVTDVKVLKGNVMFSTASAAAARQWKFAPLVKDGETTAFTTVLIFQYGQ
jgi:TonB family protein